MTSLCAYKACRLKGSTGEITISAEIEYFNSQVKIIVQFWYKHIETIACMLYFKCIQTPTDNREPSNDE